MKRSLAWLLVLSALITACGANKSAPADTSASRSAAASAPTAKGAQELFVNSCAKCHGLAGLGDGPSAGSLRTQAGLNLTILKDKTNEEIFTIISQGKGTEMPPWELVLTAEERQALVEYIRTLAKP